MSKKCQYCRTARQKSGNSDLFCDKLIRATKENGDKIERIIYKKNQLLHFQQLISDTGNGCAIKDDMAEIFYKTLKANGMLIGKVRFLSISSQM